MRAKIHPKYEECSVHCGCGVTFKTRSTRKEIRVEICSACHPFFSGKQRFIDTAGRIQRFQEKFKWDAQAALVRAGKAPKPVEGSEAAPAEAAAEPKSTEG